jgi:outer membrane protein TolC
MVRRLVRIAETEYATGRGLQNDVLRAQVEMSKLLDEKITLKKKRRVIEDRINELLNSETYRSIEPPAIVPYSDLKLNVDDLNALSLNNNAMLRVKEAEVEQAQVAVDLAGKDYYTDIDLMVSYGQRDETEPGQERADFVSASVVLTLPVWQKNKQKKKFAAAEKRHESAVKSYQDLARRLPHQVDAVVSEIRSSQENYRLIADTLLIQTEQWARSSLSAYEVGKVEFDTMINAWIRLLRFELQAENYLLTIYQKQAELEEILGGPVVQSDVISTGSKD